MLSNGELGQHLDGCPLHVTNSGSAVTLVFGGGLFHVEPLWSSVCGHDGMRIHPGTDVVSSEDDDGCRHERRMPLLSSCQTSRENLRKASG